MSKELRFTSLRSQKIALSYKDLRVFLFNILRAKQIKLGKSSDCNLFFSQIIYFTTTVSRVWGKADLFFSSDLVELGRQAMTRAIIHPSCWKRNTNIISPLFLEWFVLLCNVCDAVMKRCDKNAIPERQLCKKNYLWEYISNQLRSNLFIKRISL